jgi:lipoprotein Spr
MVHFSKSLSFLVLAGLCLWNIGCSVPVRTGYDRKIGGYKPVPTSEPAEEAVQEQAAPTNNTTAAAQEPVATNPDSTKHENSASRVRQAATRKEAARSAQKPEPRGSLENYARGWMGAKYAYGQATKTRTDCSGFVMQVYKGYYNIALDHSSSGMYKDSRGSKVSRGSLREGDLVFFGSFWKIDHVGIYLKGDRFIHASTSKGVIISPMNDKYWSHKYQGGRRFK